MNSYNEISYRYVEAPLEFYIPQHWRYQDAKNRQCSTGAFNNDDLIKAYKESLDCSVKTYKLLIDQGVAREIARGVLPLCTYSEFIFTCHCTTLMNFLTLAPYASRRPT